MLAATAYGERRVWDVATGACVLALTHDSEMDLRGFAFDTRGDRVLALGRPPTKGLSFAVMPASALVPVAWDVATGKQVLGPRVPHRRGTRASLQMALRVTADGKRLVHPVGV